MARFEAVTDSARTLLDVQRLLWHHDHLKNLDAQYALMRRSETYERMRDPSFRCDAAKMEELGSRYFTSLILRLSEEGGRDFFAAVEEAYKRLDAVVRRFDPRATVEIYFDSAHITIKSLLDDKQQDEAALRVYLPTVAPVVQRWVRMLGPDTALYGIGLFTNLHAAKGLSAGIRFYPSLPLIQILRGEIGRVLYESGVSPLRPESAFHTMLTHSTGFRARNLTFPMGEEFVKEFQAIVERYDNTVFGTIRDIKLEDICLRNGKSDKLVTFAEVAVSEQS